MIRRPPRSTLFPTRRSSDLIQAKPEQRRRVLEEAAGLVTPRVQPRNAGGLLDRKSTRLNSSHANISYAVFCLKKKKKTVSSAHAQSAQSMWEERRKLISE